LVTGDLINARFGPICGLKSDIPEIREVPLADSYTAANDARIG